MSTSSRVPPLRRRDLNNLQLTPIHRARNWTKADVSLVEWPVGSGQQLVIKDFGRRPLWFRVLLGRLLLNREWHTLRALHDLDEVPTAHHRVDRDAFIMDYCPGQLVIEVLESQMPAGLVARIDNLVQTIHARGVTHGDLHASNILINNETSGFALIDWATACYFKPNPRGWRKIIFHELAALDDRAMAKLKVTYHPASLTPRQRHLLLHGGSTVYRGFKNLRNLSDKLRGRDKKALQDLKMKTYQDRLDQYCDVQSSTDDSQD
ncbi:MAG: phosphotransferase [Abditibacteriaceae bacterium]